MNKQVLLLLCMLMAVAALQAQQNVGIGTTTPNASAALDVTSTNKGLLIPRMTTTAINSITNPAKGLLVLDTALHQLKFNIGTPAVPDWQTIVANSGWGLTGNAGTNPATHFIGTTDDQDLIFKRNNVRAGLIGPFNTSLGQNALNPASIGVNNTAIGRGALAINTNGNENTAIGDTALGSNTSGDYNTAIGSGALFSNTTGSNNTANGRRALLSNTSGGNNTANGVNALRVNSTESYNTATGFGSLENNGTGGYYNTAHGANSLNQNSSGHQNSAFGLSALYSNSTGHNNTAVGDEALISNTTGNSNVAVGIHALYRNTDRSNLVAIGDSALFNNGTGATLNFHATGNTAVGSKALYTNTTGAANTANGVEALYSNTGGNNNTANGSNALFANTTGSSNVANGSLALRFNTTGSDNIALGYQPLYSNQSGNKNIAIGKDALFANNTGSSNMAIGFEALRFNLTGFSNIAIGSGALFNNSNASNNTAIGDSAGHSNTAGSNNIFIGRSAGFNETGSNKLYISNSNANAANSLLYGEFDNKVLSVGGKLGIGTTAPHGDIQFANTLVNRKIVLYEDANNDNQFNGFGINSFIMRYQVAAPTSNHVFYAGSSASTSNELMRITGTGNVGIGSTNPLGKLEVVGKIKVTTAAGNTGLDLATSDSYAELRHIRNTTSATDHNLYFGFNGDAASSINFYNGGLTPSITMVNQRMGIGTSTPRGKLQFANDLVSRKIVLYDEADNDNQYNGFGQIAGAMRYQVSNTGVSHVFYAGTGPGTSNLLMTLTGIGLLGVGKIPDITAAGNASRLQVKCTGGLGLGFGMESASNIDRWDFGMDPNVVTPALHFLWNGNDRAYIRHDNGAYIQVSDSRYKKDITPQRPVLNDILQLNSFQYHYLDNKPSDAYSIGFMAQEVQKIFPDAVAESQIGGEKKLGINYQYFTVLAIKGLQEQQKIIVSQEERIAKLEKALNLLLEKKQ